LSPRGEGVKKRKAEKGDSGHPPLQQLDLGEKTESHPRKNLHEGVDRGRDEATEAPDTAGSFLTG